MNLATKSGERPTDVENKLMVTRRQGSRGYIGRLELTPTHYDSPLLL